MSSCVMNKVVHITEQPRNQKSFLNSKHLACPTCTKCIYTVNHDACILQYTYEVNSRVKAQSHKTTKRYVHVEKKSNTKKPERWISTGNKFSSNKTSTVHEKTKTYRSCLRWKPTDRIFNSVGLRWIPTGKIIGTCINTIDSALHIGKETCTSNTVIYANSSSLSASTSTVSEPISSQGSTSVNIISSSKLYHSPIFEYVVPTGRVVVPTGRYVVPAGKVIIIVSPGRLSLVPTSRVLSPGRVK
ncbi:hypothetical protein Tco_0008660 [Tanacetum coccineum]